MLQTNKLKGVRAEKGLTQGDMAKLLDISHLTYHLKENGKRIFSLVEAQKISGILDKPLDYFF